MMKVEISCPSCGKAYLVDEHSLGGHFVCPGCTTPIILQLAAVIAPQAAATPPATLQPAATQPTTNAPDPANTNPAVAVSPPAPAPPAVTTPAPPAATRPPAADAKSRPSPAAPPRQSASLPDEVVCPRCQLHFTPRGRPKTDVGARPVVLIVEVEGFFRDMAEEALSKECEVKTSATAVEAQQILAGDRVDAMLLALDDEQEGMTLLQSLAGKPCPILIYTSQDEAEMSGAQWNRLRELGADDIVVKGMNVADSLLRKVGTLLGRHWDVEEDLE